MLVVIEIQFVRAVLLGQRRRCCWNWGHQPLLGLTDLIYGILLSGLLPLG